jgi:hypothetical protein
MCFCYVSASTMGSALGQDCDIATNVLMRRMLIEGWLDINMDQFYVSVPAISCDCHLLTPCSQDSHTITFQPCFPGHVHVIDSCCIMWFLNIACHAA